MSERVRGCHHCIGAAYTVTNLLFNFIHGKAIANDGLSPNEIAELRLQFLESYSSGFDFFEKINRECMSASRDTDSDPFARDMMLATLLSACGKRSAEVVFKTEISACRPEWLDDFFFALAQYARERVVPNAEPRLIAAFVDAAGKHKGNLTVAKLLQEEKVQDIMKSCISALSQRASAAALAATISASVNQQISQMRQIKGADAAKTTKEELLHFLQMLPNEAFTVLRAAA